MTLIEMLVVLAVIGLVIGISVPGMVKYSQQARLKATTRQMVGLLSLARQLAISSRSEHAVKVDLEAHEVTIINKVSGEIHEQRLKLPSTVSIEVRVGGATSTEPQVVFRSSGALSSRTVSMVLATQEKTHTIVVTAATGTVAVE